MGAGQVARALSSAAGLPHQGVDHQGERPEALFGEPFEDLTVLFEPTLQPLLEILVGPP